MSNRSTEKRVALVTGASSGIGKEVARRLIKEGLIVYVVARRVDKMKDLEELGAIPLKMDITKSEHIQKVVRTIQENHNGVDILINNAGVGNYGAVEDVTIEEARYQFEVNLFGLARLTQLVLPFMRENRSGKIINISSMYGTINLPLGSWYHATKHALEGWSDCLRLELAPFNIDVVIIQPGAIMTEFGDLATTPMTKRNGIAAYSEATKKRRKLMEQYYEKGGGSHPSVVADTVSKAINAKRPKTRYAVGKYAKPMIFFKKWFSDRIFDKFMMTLFG